MKKNLMNVLNAKNSLINGGMALIIIGVIALGCTCNDKDGFQFGDNKDSNSATGTPEKKEEGNPFETPTEKKEIVKADASKGEIPSDEELQEIVKETMMNFNDAIQRGDFSDFHKTISKVWQGQTKPKTFEDGFRSFIEKKVDISSIRDQQARFSPTPKIDTSQRLDRLMVEGTYPTSPSPTQFKLQFIPEGEDWKLFAIDVRTRSFRQ
jgi:hypothetical protein